MSKPVWVAKQFKHVASVALKRLNRRVARPVRVAVASAAFRVVDRFGYSFEPTLYPGEWFSGPTNSTKPGQLPKVAWVFWTGNNELSANRQRCLASLRRANSDFDVRFVGPQEIGDLQVAQHPFHPAFEFLSFVHRSDYLRAYVMHFHGGAYVDVKSPRNPLAGPWERLAASSAWLAGFPELDADMCSQLPGRIGRDVKVHHRRVVGTSSFIFKPGSGFTIEWLAEVERRLDHHLPMLREFPGDARGWNEGYPLGWTELLGDVIQPLCLKYQQHVLLDDRLRLRFTSYK